MNKALGTSLSMLALVGGLVLGGCSAGDENPITPERMQEIRKQEAEDHKNFNPTSRPPGSPGGT